MELLVVIAIIGILMSLLLPSLHQAREKAKTALCLSNIRQVSLVAQNFMSSHDSKLPAVSGIGNRWDSDASNDVPSENPSGLEGHAQIMLFAQGLETSAGAEKLEGFLCPSTRQPFQNLENSDLRQISYMFNINALKAGAGGERRVMSNAIKTMGNTKNSNSPSDVIMFSEGDNVIGYVGQYTMIEETNEPWYGPLQHFAVRWHYRLDHYATRGTMTLNNVYYDGHAKTLPRWTNISEMTSTQWSYFNYD